MLEWFRFNLKKRKDWTFKVQATVSLFTAVNLRSTSKKTKKISLEVSKGNVRGQWLVDFDPFYKFLFIQFCWSPP